MIVVPSVHPAFILRSAGDGSASKYKDTVIADVKKALQFRTRKPYWDEQVIWQCDPETGVRYKNLYPTASEVGDFIARVARTNIVIDVETTGEEPLQCQLICIGIASENGLAMNIPVLKSGGVPYWETQEEKAFVLGLVAWLMAHPETPKTFHNGAFDTLVLYAHGMPVTNWVDDTMLAHHVVDGELPHGLAYVASRYLEVPYWKDDVKGDKSWLDLDDETMRSYNLRDCLTTRECRKQLLADVQSLGLQQLYREEVALAEIMMRATRKGLMIDLQRRDDETIDDRPRILGKDGRDLGPNPRFGKPKGLGPYLRGERQEALNVLRQLSGDPQFNPASPIQLQKFLYETLGFPVVARSKKSGKPSTDKNAMVLLSLHADSPERKAALKNLVKFRKSDKMLGTWVEGLPVLWDGRVHPVWKIHGTVTGRLSSSPNAQNWNAAIKHIFRAGPGNKYVSIDLSQAELRVMAYFSGDQELLKMYAQGINVHTVNATLLFHVKCGNPKDINPQTEAYLRQMVPIFFPGDPENNVPPLSYDDFPVMSDKARWKITRTLAKNFVFGDNYGAEPETLYNVLRSKRDPDTDELLFGDLELGLIEGLKIVWEQMLHPSIPTWWQTITQHTIKQGYYRDPLSGRIQWYRAGWDRNQMLNRPIQGLVGSWMNKCMILIDRALQQMTGGAAVIVSQVHDALTVEAPEQFVEITKQILKYYLNQSFSLPGFPNAVLPALDDDLTVGDYFDEI